MMIIQCLILAFCASSFAFDEKEPFYIGLTEKDLNPLLKFLRENEESLSNNAPDPGISAVINKFADKVLSNIKTYSIEHKFDPMALQGFDGKFLTARVTLSNGTLGGFSTVARNGDVVLNYSSVKKILDLKVPIKFDNIHFEYKYHVIILLIGPSGRLIGRIDGVKVDLELTFDLNIFEASVKKLNLMNSGHVSIQVEGGVIEAVIDVLSQLITTIIHPIILAIIQGIVKGVANDIVDSINKALHPDGTNIIFN